jgi:hypothetical protein
MALRNQPYLPLYVQDFMTDEKLMECSAETTGFYIRLMCILHKSDEYGTFLLKQKDKQNSNQIENFALKFAKYMPYSFEIILRSLEELISENVILIEDDKIIQKRMVKDNYISNLRSEVGKKGGNKTKFAKAKIKANGKAKVQANTENEYENENENIIKDDNIIYAENVKMKKSEFEKLNADYGAEDTKTMIQILDNYKGANGKKYKSDYRAILNWVVNRLKDEKTRNNGTNKKSFTKRDEVHRLAAEAAAGIKDRATGS